MIDIIHEPDIIQGDSRGPGNRLTGEQAGVGAAGAPGSQHHDRPDSQNQNDGVTGVDRHHHRGDARLHDAPSEERVPHEGVDAVEEADGACHYAVRQCGLGQLERLGRNSRTPGPAEQVHDEGAEERDRGDHRENDRRGELRVAVHGHIIILCDTNHICCDMGADGEQHDRGARRRPVPQAQDESHDDVPDVPEEEFNYETGEGAVAEKRLVGAPEIQRYEVRQGQSGEDGGHGLHTGAPPRRDGTPARRPARRGRGRVVDGRRGEVPR